MLIKLPIILLSLCCTALAQLHQHGTTSKEDGNYNPFIVSDIVSCPKISGDSFHSEG